MDPEADDPDVGRLQALLEARGIPPHVFGSLGEFRNINRLAAICILCVVIVNSNSICVYVII